MQLNSSRRQNSSCDQCRQSKRRCLLLRDVPASRGQTCTHCSQLGKRCTFEFVASRKKQKMTRSSFSPQQQSHSDNTLEYPAFESTPPAPSNLCSAECRAVADGVLSSDLGTENLFNFDIFPADFSEELWSDYANTIRFEPQPATTATKGPGTIACASGSLAPAQTQHSRRHFDEGASIGLWHGSPVKLLNSSVTSYFFNRCLGAVYDTMMTGVASRYLSYSSNAFAGVYKYVFNTDLPLPMSIDRTHQHTLGTGNMHHLDLIPKSMLDFPQPTTGHESLDSPMHLVDQARRVTLIGVVRFLDNFGDLYGNRIDKKTRKQDEIALTAALQAFALQWSPCTDGVTVTTSPSCPNPIDTSPGDHHSYNTSLDTASKRFSTAWFAARSHLINTKNHCNFTHLYVLFLFHMTAVPSEAVSNMEAGEDPNELLQYGLHQMVKLQTLVECYCDNLGHDAVYRNLLKSSIEIIQWYGYIRDTVASIMSGRPCVLPAATRRGYNTNCSPVACTLQIPWLLDVEVPEICREAVGSIFRLWRQIIQLKTSLGAGNQPIDNDLVAQEIRECFATIDEFNTRHLLWMKQCVVDFFALSEKSKLSSAFLILFWNLGLLWLSEQIEDAHNLRLSSQEFGVMTKAREYQTAAVISIATISQCILDTSVSRERVFFDTTGMSLPLIAYHANTSLVVMALVKGVEHTIRLNIFSQSTPMPSLTDGNNTPLSASWKSDLKPLLSCLLALEITAAGSHVARSALRTLMRQYSDILMDCWSPDNLSD